MALQGTLDTFGLPDVLRLLASTHKTGRLDVAADRGHGTVWLDGGTLVAAQSSATAAVDDMVRVVFELLRHRDGQFTFEAADHVELTGVPREVDDVVGAAERTLAEWRAIEALVPSLEVWVSLVADLPDAEVVLDSVRWRTIVAIGAGAQVGAVGDDLGLGEVEACQAVAELVSAGLAVVGEIPAELLEQPLPGDPGGARPSTADPVLGASAAGPVGTDRPPLSLATEPGRQNDWLAAATTAEGPHDSRSIPRDDGSPVSGGIATVAAPSAPAYVPLYGSDAVSESTEVAGVSAAASTQPATGTIAYDPYGLSSTSPAPTAPVAATESTEMAASSVESGADVWSAGRRSLGIDIPGLPSLSARWDPEPEATVDETPDGEVSVELGPLTPLAARAIAMAAQATSDAEREAAIAQAIEANDQPLDRGVLLRFLSSVRGG